jgi:predicted 3-demethylubiquinone-9 3-methyltransferase (glyoxalase superfamily)
MVTSLLTKKETMEHQVKEKTDLKSRGTGLQKITTHLWFDREAREAATFYVSVFGGDSKITGVTPINDTPSGNAELVTFRLRGYDFMAISAGPVFKFNQSVSFILNFDPSQIKNAASELDRFWVKLSEGGQPLMAIGEYPFSKRYGWIQDKYGLSWQLLLSGPEGESRPFITPSLMFTGAVSGKAEEAKNYYISVFKNSREGIVARYEANMEPDKEGTVMFEDFMLDGVWLAAMDSARMNDLTFNEAISLVVTCSSQEEIDYYWEKLSAKPEAEQCGWCKDPYGVSWQIVPSRMGELLGGTPEQRERVTQAFLKMKKFDIAELERAYNGH